MCDCTGREVLIEAQRNSRQEERRMNNEVGFSISSVCRPMYARRGISGNVMKKDERKGVLR